MYKTEFDLVQKFKREYAESFLKIIEPRATNRFILLDEFDSYNGVADIVFAIHRPYALRKKYRKTVNHNWVTSLLGLQEKKVISLDDYVDLFGVSSKTARLQLENFAQADFVECIEKNRYRISKTYKPILETVISVEAKLRDWRRALAQAFRYKRFSHYSFVLLPTRYANRAIDNLNLFQKYDIGLITLSSDGVSIYNHPIRRECLKSDAFFRVNEVAYSHLVSTA